MKIICIGSGLAGLNFCLEVSAYAHVKLLSQYPFRESNSFLAKGGIAIPIGADDSPGSHVADTLIAGDGLCDEDTVRFIIGQAPGVYDQLRKLGIIFTGHNGQPHLGREGGHTHHRIVHIQDESGRYLMEHLHACVLREPNIEILTGMQLLQLDVKENQCFGAWFYNTGEQQVVYENADAVALATGGCGNLYLNNSNATGIIGEGYAVAHAAAAVLQNMEFMQFHPTLLYDKSNAASFLITEALRGAGAVLRNRDGEDFMKALHPLASLAPRDIVSRSIFEEMHRSNQQHVYLDTHAIRNAQFETYFPALLRECNARHIDRYAIPVTPAAHYMCGGVKTDLNAATSVNRLYAIGEVSCTGLHGANRLASNSLLEALVMSGQAAAHCRFLPLHHAAQTPVSEFKFGLDNAVVPFEIEELQTLMWDNFGIVRKQENMLRASETLGYWEKQFLQPIGIAQVSSYHMLQTAKLIAAAARQRNFSKGCHVVS